MSDDGAKVRCIVRAYEDTDEFSVLTREATLTVLEGADGPIWDDVPDISGDGADDYTYDMNAHVTSSGGDLTGWVVEGSSAVSIDQSGILTVDSGGAAEWNNVIVYVTDDNGTSVSNFFTVERRGLATISQHPSDLTVVVPTGGQFSCTFAHPGQTFLLWQAHTGDENWQDAGDVFSDAVSDTANPLVLTTTSLDDDGIVTRLRIRAYADNTDYESYSNEASTTVNEFVQLQRFDDVDGLVCYWNCEEGVVNMVGDKVESIEGVYGSEVVDLVNPWIDDADTDMPFGVYDVGTMPAIGDTGTERRGNMTAIFTETPLQEECTIVWAEQRHYNNQGTISLALGRPSDGASRRDLSRSGAIYRMVFPNNSSNTDIDILAETPRACACTFINYADPTGHQLRVDEEVFAYESLDYLSEEIDRLIIYANPAGNNNMRGGQSLWAVYNRKLTGEDLDYVINLTQYWIQNNEAPPVETE